MLMHTVRLASFVVFPGLAAAFTLSCGGGDSSTVNGGNGTGASNTGTGGTVSLGTGDGKLPGDGSGGTSTTITPDQACADSSATADAIPAVVQMVIDISGSMDWGADGDHNPPRGMSKWDITSGALVDAVANLPASVAVGVNFYPNNPQRNSCIRNRIDLPIALLGAANSAQRRAFDSAINNANPSDGTPTHAAYMFGAETVAASKLAGRKFVLLITDGIPTYPLDCSGDGMGAIDNAPLVDAVDAAFKDANSISTFVIGSPGSDDARSDLSQMATKGGTASAGCSDAGPSYCHLDMTSATDFGAALAAGLADIAGRISQCEYAIPPAPVGQDIDPSRVNVLYTQGSGNQSSILQDAQGDCASGWQYDNDMNPTKITLCGSDCEAVKADAGAKIDLIFGCTTETNVPVK